MMKPITFDWTKMKNIQKIHRVLYAIGLGPLIGRIILFGHYRPQVRDEAGHSSSI
ncbi:MAG: hypothetical protein IPL71_17165 [Anaerolineales bacterium]|uniref:hypothetical protein n=1 Tax=Candidatus Villigracilis proximus TaxID=3140683 RepID=UPI00313547C1|nr:hypothetical protein [Anaerolineales bacterium]